MEFKYRSGHTPEVGDFVLFEWQDKIKAGWVRHIDWPRLRITYTTTDPQQVAIATEVHLHPESCYRADNAWVAAELVPHWPKKWVPPA